MKGGNNECSGMRFHGGELVTGYLCNYFSVMFPNCCITIIINEIRGLC